jgi:hypothetical protein
MADQKNGAQGASSTATEKGGKRKQISKVEAVGRAMAVLGAEASRGDIQGYIRQKFGVKIGLDHISNCKGELAKRAGKAARPAGLQTASTKPAAAPSASRRPSVPEARAAQPAMATQTRPVGGTGSSHTSILLEDVLTAKTLIDRVGAGPLKTLIDGLAK